MSLNTISISAPSTDLPKPRRSSLYGCIHVPAHPVQAFVRHDPLLRRKPFAVLDGTFPLFTVVALNKEARRAGVREGMSQLQLEPFPDLTIRHRSPQQEESMHRALLDCAYGFTPRIEDTAADTITLDLNGLAQLWGTPRAIAQKLFQTAVRLGLDAHIAVGPNPESTIHAVRGDTAITVMTPENVSEKLASLPLNVLASTPEIMGTFRLWGVHTFRDLAGLPTIQLSERVGQEGLRLQQLTRGDSMRPLRVHDETPCFKESLEIEHPVDSIEPLTFILNRLIHQLSERLRIRDRAANALHLTLHLEPENASSTPAPFVRTLRPPIPIRDPKILLKLFQLHLEIHRPPARVTGVTLEAEPAAPRRVQNSLFIPMAPEPEKLQLTVARIRSIVGPENVGSPEVLDTHRPNAFRVEDFTLPAGSNSSSRPHSTLQRAGGAGRTGPAPPMALRILRPAQPATVEMKHGEPSRVLFGGKIGKVITARGPWNASGEWWRSEPWNREEWDVEVQSGWQKTLYRIYHDPRQDTWFVDGSYD